MNPANPQNPGSPQHPANSQHPTSPALEFLAGAALGTRVVVRTRIDGGYTDALGYLRAHDATHCAVETKRGLVSLVLTEVVLAKEVPPPPAPRPRRIPAP